jgi:nitrite reductase/ring-hydroxylating ferredoxin subunit
MSRKIPIAPAREFVEKRSFKFVIPQNSHEPREGFAFQLAGQIHAYYNECAHISLPLDWDDNDFFTLDHSHLVCKHHGAEYTPANGACVAGPCVGAKLKAIVTAEDEAGMVWALVD